MGQPPYGQYGQYGPYDPYQPPAQPPAVQQHHYYGAPAPRTNGMATASMILGIVGILFCGATSILAVIFGHVAHSQIRNTGEGGHGMAIAGLILGYLAVALWLFYWLVVVILWGAAIGSLETSTSTY